MKFIIIFGLFAGLWGSPDKKVSVRNQIRADSVLICNSRNAEVYHDHYCRGLKACTHEIKKVTLGFAKNELGRRACLICY
jgi:hypothetical protein